MILAGMALLAIVFVTPLLIAEAEREALATCDRLALARMPEIGLCMGYVTTHGKLPAASSKC